ncbi:MAG: GNAT family N-acetyltransferase [Acidisphaera sp.]|nr:GNAT family N-acetyltransferase [Acidisphaera sp.]
MVPDIELTDTPGPGTWQSIVKGLTDFNERFAGPEDFRFLILVLRQPGTGEVLGGLWGRTLYAWLYVNVLFVPEALRRQGLGSRLMRDAEAEALARGCRGALVDTFDFQARPFYERLGYTVFGTVPDYPPGHECCFLLKRLRDG